LSYCFHAAQARQAQPAREREAEPSGRHRAEPAQSRRGAEPVQAAAEEEACPATNSPAARPPPISAPRPLRIRPRPPRAARARDTSGRRTPVPRTTASIFRREARLSRAVRRGNAPSAHGDERRKGCRARKNSRSHQGKGALSCNRFWMAATLSTRIFPRHPPRSRLAAARAYRTGLCRSFRGHESGAFPPSRRDSRVDEREVSAQVDHLELAQPRARKALAISLFSARSRPTTTDLPPLLKFPTSSSFHFLEARASGRNPSSGTPARIFTTFATG